MNDSAGDETAQTAAGTTLVNLAWAGTGLLVAAGVAGVLAPDTLGIVTAVVACALFAVGCAAFLWAYAVGVSRSRDEQVTLAGLFFGAGSVPREIAFRLRMALVVQVVAAGAAASIRPFTDLAFAVLAPIFGLGMLSLWSARHGTYPPREAPGGPE